MKPKGYSYTVDVERLLDYARWPIGKKLRWLFLGNKLRRSLPRRTLQVQDAFREGKL